MAKDSAFWFPHDYEPTSDFKMQALIGEYGAVGYGIFWRITEMLHSEQEHRLPLKPYLFLAIAKQMLQGAEVVERVIRFSIETCELFESDGVYFWSLRVNRNIEDRAIISQKRSISGKKGAIAKQMLQANKQLPQANKQTVAQDRTGQDNTGQINKKADWIAWGEMIVNNEDQYWEQMRVRKVSRDEMDQFISVAIRNDWKMDTQTDFRVSLKGFKVNGQNKNHSTSGKFVQ